MWRLAKPLYCSVTILMLILGSTLWQYARAQETPEKLVEPPLGEKTLPQQERKKTVKQLGGTTTVTPKKDQTFESVPSATARKEGFKKNEGFGSLSDYSQPGYVGNSGFVTRPPAGVVVVPPHAVGKKPPQCNTLHILVKGTTSVVKSCAQVPQNAYEGLCQSNQGPLRIQCGTLCKVNRACQHWQLRPHLYEEWGCLESPPKTRLKLIPHSYCETFEGCICTRTPS
jgi:hypothetical protein